MELLIIRHGQSEADPLGVHEGRADFALTELGHRQARAMGAYVSSLRHVTKIFSSTLTRARQTAEHLAEACGLEAVPDGGLMEFQNGLLAGLSYAEANKRYPRPRVKYPHSEFYGCESEITFRMRGETAMSKLLNESDNDDVVAVVSHGGMINRLFQSFLALPVGSGAMIMSYDTSVHHFYYDKAKNERLIFRINDITHLETNGIAWTID